MRRATATPKPPPVVPVSAAQADFLSCDKPFVAFTGGIGAGKSWVLCYDRLTRAKSGGLYMIAAPTFPILRDSTLRSFFEVAAVINVRPAFNKSEMTATVGGAEFLFRSADEPERMRGPNLRGVSLDEASLMHEDAFKISIGRLRQGGSMGDLRAAFTPKGKRHWTYTIFGMGAPDTALIHAATADNPFLDESFETTIRRQYTSQYARQELGGEFIELGGTLVQREWFKLVETLPAAATSRIRYWDKAGTDRGENPNASFTAGVLMARYPDGTFGIEDVVRGQWSAGTRDRIIRETADLDKLRFGFVTVYQEQEPGSAGKDVARAFVTSLAGYNAKAAPASGDKVTRFLPFAAQVEAGNVLVRLAQWTQDYLDELCAFPEGSQLDQADATSGAFNRLCEAGDWSMAGSMDNAPPAPAPAAVFRSPINGEGADPFGIAGNLRPGVFRDRNRG